MLEIVITEARNNSVLLQLGLANGLPAIRTSGIASSSKECALHCIKCVCRLSKVVGENTRGVIMRHMLIAKENICCVSEHHFWRYYLAFECEIETKNK